MPHPRRLPIAVLFLLATLAGCSAVPGPAIQTLEPGVVKIAITGVTVDDPLDPEQWMYHYAERLAQDLHLRADWHVVPFDKSWELAGKDVVDVVATNLASFPDRVSPGGTFSAPFLYEQRALRIRAADRAQYRTIADFLGKKVGAVKGMAAERDLLKRAPAGVEIVSTTTFPELYAAVRGRAAGRGGSGRVLRPRRPRDSVLRPRPGAHRPSRPEPRPARGVGVRGARQEHGTCSTR